MAYVIIIAALAIPIYGIVRVMIDLFKLMKFKKKKTNDKASGKRRIKRF